MTEVAARAYLEARGATVTWNRNITSNGIVYSNATVSYGSISIDITGRLVNGNLMYEDSVLDGLFGWNVSTVAGTNSEKKTISMPSTGLNTINPPSAPTSIVNDIVKSGLVLGGTAAMIDTPAPGPMDAVGAIIIGASLIIAGGVALYSIVTQSSIKDKYGDQTVKDVLKQRKGSIKNAPIPPGGPSWEQLLLLTMEAVRRMAGKREVGFKTIWKLLNDSRFYK